MGERPFPPFPQAAGASPYLPDSVERKKQASVYPIYPDYLPEPCKKLLTEPCKKVVTESWKILITDRCQKQVTLPCKILLDICIFALHILSLLSAVIGRFSLCRLPGRYNPDHAIRGSVTVTDDQQICYRAHAQNDKPLFVLRMFRIINHQGPFIIENRLGFLKGYFMFRLVDSVLILVPFK